VPPAVALLNYISCGILRRIFCQTGIFAGFSLRKSFTSLVGSVQLWWQGTIYFLASLVHWEITRGPILCFFAGFFLYFILQKEERSCDEQVGGRGALNFLVCLQGCDWWGERRGILYIKASVVQWKDIRPWQPRSSFRVRRSSVGHSYPEGAA
jgi:hypothetical protein